MKRILVLFLLVTSCLLQAQVPTITWEKNISGSESCPSIAVDIYGNSYMTGTFQGTVDFDPGPGTYTLSAPPNFSNAFITKLDSNGNFIWVKEIHSTVTSSGNSNLGNSIKVDTSGIYVVGMFNGTSDFNPGAGIDTLTSYTGSGGNPNLFILKLDLNGNFLWVNQLNTILIASSYRRLTLSADGDVYLTGLFSGTIDFDSGVGTHMVSSSNPVHDVFILKLGRNGEFKWVKTFSGSSIEVNQMHIDLNGNVWATGDFYGTINFDPGASNFGFSATCGCGTDNIFISKLDSSGNFLWATQIGNSFGSSGTSLTSDEKGNVYITGTFHSFLDFDPGVGTYVLSAYNQQNFFILKLDNAGDFIWAKQFAGGNIGTLFGPGPIIGIDTKGIYIAGEFRNNIDFDPGPGTYNLAPVGGYQNLFVSKLDTVGNLVWIKQMGGANALTLKEFVVDTSGNLYSLGTFTGTVDFNIGQIPYNQTSIGTYPNTYALKMGQICVPPSSPVNISPISNQTICANNSATLLAVGFGMINWYLNQTGGLPLSIGTSFTTPILSAGIYTYYAEALTCVESSSRTAITLTVNMPPTVTVSGADTLCIGSSTNLNATGAVTYSWSTGVITSSITLTPTINTIYNVVGINSCGTDTTTISVIVDTSCADIWPGDANSDGTADNLDVLELGLHYTQTGLARASISNNWQSYFSNNWSGTITNGKNLNHSDCNGDGYINDNDTLAIYNNYGLTHTFKPGQQTVTNPQLSIVSDQPAVVKGSWGSSSIYLGDAANPINNINGVAFTVNFDNSLIETNSVWIEYPTSFVNTSNQNLHFRKLDFANGNLYTATTHTVNNNANGNGLIAKLHYQIKSSLTTDAVLNLGIVQANQSNVSGIITPLTSGTATLMAMGSSVGIKEFSTGSILIYPNPAKDVLTVQSTNEFSKVELMNVTGQVLLSEDMRTNTYQLNLSSVAKGIYFVNIYQNDKIISRNKVVVVK